jgi:hypothetical protein
MSDDAFDEEVSEPEAEGSGVTINDFVALMTMPSAFIFMPCKEIWPGSNVNLRLPRVIERDERGNPMHDPAGRLITTAPTKWLAQNNSVEQMTWCPGLPTKITDRLMINGGWIERAGVCSFNLYRPPRLALGDAMQAGRWIEHFHKIYPDNADHCICWLAHRVQRPGEKINHALVLGGEQGIGKDTLLEPVRQAVEPWNFQDVSPGHMLGRFNSFAKSVVLRVNEARDLGEFDRFKFYDHTKNYAAAPPDSLRVDEKHLREYYVLNCLGMIITTNHKTDGIYLPPGDRRHYVTWSRCTKEEFPDDCWNGLWGWYQRGGIGHVAAYLAELDLTGFDPKAPPPKTTAFRDIVLANAAPEDAELADVLDKMGNPGAATLDALMVASTGTVAADWLLERKNRRTIPHRMERCGYTPLRNPNAKDGLWKLQDGRRQVVYVLNDLPQEMQFAAVERLGRSSEKEPLS